MSDPYCSLQEANYVVMISRLHFSKFDLKSYNDCQQSHNSPLTQKKKKEKKTTISKLNASHVLK